MRYVGALLPHADLERERAKSNVGLATKPRSALNVHVEYAKYQRLCERSRQLAAAEVELAAGGAAVLRVYHCYTIVFQYLMCGWIICNGLYSGSTLYPQHRLCTHLQGKGAFFTGLGVGHAFAWAKPVCCTHSNL